MALGRRRQQEQTMWVTTQDLPRSPGHPFYQKLNEFLAEADFDSFVETLCALHYAETLGRPSIPPGVYFRMLLIGYFEGIGSQRGIAWRCADSLSLRSFLGLEPTQASPDHSSLTVIRKRLPLEVHEEVFAKVLSMAHERKLLSGRTVAVDATTLEANAAMKSIVRKDTCEDYRMFLARLAEEAGLENPTEEDLRRFDKGRKGKKMSNNDWGSSSDPDSRITKMKDGRTRLAYKAEHVLDLDSELVLAAKIYHGDRGDTDSLEDSLTTAESNLATVDGQLELEEVVADKGYHSSKELAGCKERNVRTYIAEPQQVHKRRWANKPAEWKDAFHANRRRCRGDRGRRLQRLRSERVERSFAHMCETGGARRTWIRGVVEVSKRYLIQGVARNLGVMMRRLFGVGTPRSLQGSRAFACCLHALLHMVIGALRAVLSWLAGIGRTSGDFGLAYRRIRQATLSVVAAAQIASSSTGC